MSISLDLVRRIGRRLADQEGERAMSITKDTQLSHRDRAVLRAVAAGRCQISGKACVSLVIDGLPCCDQLVGMRLTRAGLIAAADSQPGTARLTPSGRAMLEAA
jgi:hypothetical protein